VAVSINKFEKVGRNLWKYDGHFFRLFGKGITPNNCWLAAPEMRELVDINIATGEDVYSNWVQPLDSGTVTIHDEHVRIV
jgi:hypothetical protein